MASERGTLWFVKIYARAHVRLVADLNMLVIFGDNMVNKGLGGQAAACRGETNVLGIPTKWRPAKDPMAFFEDQDLPKVGRHITSKFHEARDHLLRGLDVAYPSSGIGTGFAMLETRAPKIMSLIHSGEKMLRESAAAHYNVNNLSIAWGQRKLEQI